MSDRDQDRDKTIQERDAAQAQGNPGEGILKDEQDDLLPEPSTPTGADFVEDMGEATSHPPDESPASDQDQTP